MPVSRSTTLPQNPLARLALAVAIPFAALALQWLLWDYFKPYVWFLFFPAAFLSAWIGGLAGGLAATFLSALLVWYFFIPPSLSFAAKNLSAGYSVAVFILMGCLFAWFHERLQQAMRRVESARLAAEAANERMTQLYEKTLELDKLKDQFFANVSHELRTPLTLILAPLEARLLRPPADDASAAERHETEVMLRNARLLHRHVTDLLDAAKLEAGGMVATWASLDLTRLARGVCANFESLAAQRHISYTQDLPETLPAEADAEKLQRILLNLLSNAFKFVPDGGIIAVRLRQDGDTACIEVQDNGYGIPENQREAVFERFRQGDGAAQRRVGGTGLGLAIAKDFVELHGGSVKVVTAPGGGALFVVRLPLHAPAGTTLAPAVALDAAIERQAVDEFHDQLPGARRTQADGKALADQQLPLVLVVEDNVDLNELIADVLRPYYRVHSAFNGREGVGLALALQPDLIISDLMMPSMSGDQMVEELRRRPSMRDVPIVILTAMADEATRLRLLRYGVQDYLNKPFSSEELLARIGGLVATRQRTISELRRSAERLRRLADVVEKTAAVRDLPTLTAIVTQAVRQLTGADGVALALRDGEHSHYVDEDAIAPLWKGQRFPLEHGIAGWAMLHAETVVIPDIHVDPRIVQANYRQTFVKSLSIVPVGRKSPVGAIGCYWAEWHEASNEELELQQALADAFAVGLDNLDRYREMQEARQAAEQSALAAQESEMLLRTSLESLRESQTIGGLGSYVLDVAQDHWSSSEVLDEIFGIDEKYDHSFAGWAGLVQADDRQMILDYWSDEVSGRGRPFDKEYRIVRHRDRAERWVHGKGRLSFDAAGRLVSMRGTIQDITERKRSEAALRESEQRLKLLIEHAPAALAMFDRDMRYLAVSQRWLDDYSLRDSNLIGQSHYEVFPEIQEDLKSLHRRGMAGEVLHADEDRFTRANGNVQWVRWEMLPWHSADGIVGGIVIFSEDVTARKLAEDELRDLNADLERRVVERTSELIHANTELDSFAYAVSHDLRAPLRALNGFSHALIEDYGASLDGEAKVFLDQIGIASKRMSALIDGILALSQSTRGELQRESIDLSALASEIAAELSRGDAGRTPLPAIEIAPDLHVEGDARMVAALLRNLLGNAWKYTGKCAVPAIRLYRGELEDMHGICIADNGAGFEMAHADQLFQPFHRLHRQDEFPGLGVGLATVQRIVRRHGGEIRAHGEPGKGATFCFTLAGKAGIGEENA